MSYFLPLQRIAGTKVFSVPLQSLVSPEDKVPLFMDHLIMLIETHGLYTEGIYRKSGSSPKIKAMKVALDSGVVGKFIYSQISLSSLVQTTSLHCCYGNLFWNQILDKNNGEQLITKSAFIILNFTCLNM